MSRIKKVFFVSVLITLLADNLFSVVGRDRMQILKFSPSPWASAMADTTVSVRGNVNNMFYNPAGVFSFNSFDLSISYTSWFQALNFFNFAGKMKVGSIGDIGVGFVSLMYDDLLKVTEENGVLVQTDEEVDLGDYFLAFNYSRNIGEKMFAGIQIKLANEKIERSTTSAGIDAGIVYVLTEKISAGISVLNIGIKDAPLIIKSGANYRLYFGKNGGLILSGELDKMGDSGVEVGIGGEATLLNMFFVRTGYRIGEDSGAFRIGGGIKYKQFQIDYSFNSYGELGNVNRIGFKMGI